MLRTQLIQSLTLGALLSVGSYSLQAKASTLISSNTVQDAIAAALAAPSPSPSPTSSLEDASGAMDLNYPYASVPDKSCPQIVEPDNSSGFLFSKDCKTVFVLPPSAGTKKVDSITISSTVNDCVNYNRYQSDIQTLEQQLFALTKQQIMASPDSTRAQNLLTQIDMTTKMIADARSLYAGVQAATAQVDFQSGFNQQFINQWVVANLLAFQQGVTFVRAPINRSILTDTEVQRGSSDSDPVVLSSTVPGFHSDPKDTSSVVFGDGMSGQVVLSLAGVCPYADLAHPTTPMTVAAGGITGVITANRSYSIPVISGFGYKASLKIENMLSLTSDAKLTKGQFTESDFINVLASGSAQEEFDFKPIELEAASGTSSDPAQQNAHDEFFIKLHDAVHADLENQLLQRMIAAGIIKVEAAQQAPEAVSGGTIGVPATRRVCHRNSGPFGLWDAGESCNDETYSIPQWVDGNSQRATNQKDQTTFDIEDSMAIHQVIYRPHTQSFQSVN